jgi:hypothetical protein
METVWVNRLDHAAAHDLCSRTQTPLFPSDL